MIKVFTRGIPQNINRRTTVKILRTPEPFIEKREKHALIIENILNLTADDLKGYSLILSSLPSKDLPIPSSQPILHSIEALDHLNEGDVVMGDAESGIFRTVYLRGSHQNTIFTTDACNSNCLMCSQPPKEVDSNARLEAILDEIRLFDTDTKVMCITGGEPTLMGDNLLKIISECRNLHPSMKLHMLTNGRTFKDEAFATKYASILHPDLTAGIPLYSDIDYLHDYVVQAEGAFWETINGIHNLGRLGQKIEIRIVVHKQTYERLPQLAEFIYRNMPFVNHVTFMGLEIVGYTKANLESLWIDPFDYQEKLEAAVIRLAREGMHVSIYNHQLCVLKKNLWKFSRASISDWKNDYDKECGQCDAREQCGGFFQWNPTVRSSHITAIHYQ
ncbi:MAG: His-Xaa-Ser system radical SAM maturase HxsC [Deltaproteobacteria bacterium]|nr:MAG: His-Xaa-Ser system radical SAM maturase HxsC [Deltaproteobacteria bacterium]